MNTKLTFKQLAEKGKKILAEQKPVTLEQARAQVARLKNASKAHVDEYSTLNRGAGEFESPSEHENLI